MHNYRRNMIILETHLLIEKKLIYLHIIDLRSCSHLLVQGKQQKRHE
jgi:hypothetical protein